MKLPNRVTVWEVGPRDGLQNESVFLSTEDKIAWIDQLALAGCTHIEVTSFVSPRWIPMLADADEVCAGLTRRAGVSYGALVPNERGLERALSAGIDVVSVFLSASETHNHKNINASIDESLGRLRPVVSEAKQQGKRVRGYVSTAFGCPYEGHVASDRVRDIAETLCAYGVDEVSLGDTIGVATPLDTERVLMEVGKSVPLAQLALHMHDTYGMAMANLVVGLQMGITTVDSATGGLGGCPYAPGASGNVATDDLLYLLRGCQVETGIDANKLGMAAAWLEDRLGHPMPSHARAVGRGCGVAL